MQLEGTIHQDRTVLPAERPHLPGKVRWFVIEFESRLDYVSVVALECGKDLKLLELVSRLYSFVLSVVLD